jgi:hypothetical protein
LLISYQRVRTLNYTIYLIHKMSSKHSTLWVSLCTIDISEKKKVSHGPIQANGGNGAMVNVVWPLGIFTNTLSTLLRTATYKDDTPLSL